MDAPHSNLRPIHSTRMNNVPTTIAPHSPLQEPSLAKDAETLAALDRSQMWVEGQYLPYLQRAGLTSFEAMMNTTAGRCLRALADRENWRLELHDAHQQPRGAYLKKHHVRGWRQWLRAKLGIGPGQSAGRVEAGNVRRMEQDGIAAMRLIAYG